MPWGIGANAHRSDAMRFAGWLAVGYFLVGAAWVTFSDQFVQDNFPSPYRQQVQTYKGWGFIGCTALGLGAFAYWRCRALDKAEQAEAAAATDRQSLLEVAPVPMLLRDEAGRVTWCNDAMERTFGFSALDLIGQTHTLTPPGESEEEAGWRRRVMQGQTLRGLATQRLTREGGVREVVIAMAPVYHGQPTAIGIVEAIEDVSDRIHAERLAPERDKLQQTNHDLDQVLGTVGHELRTPLTALQASSEYLLTDGIEGLSDEAQQLQHNMHQQVQSLTEMVNNMLEGARLDSGQARWEFQTQRVYDLIEEAVAVVRPLVDESNVDLNFEVSPEGLTVNGDRQALRRLVVNLLSNAQKHTPSGHITVHAWRETQGGHDWLRLAVRDTGKGMSAEVTERLGKAFALNEGGVDARSSAGLGLAICKRIVAAHGGQLLVQSTPKEGSTFTAMLRGDLQAPAQPQETHQVIQQVAA
jgi:PAS domain S-box-containing protein